MDQTDSFGYWVRRRRKALDLTQAQLARHLGCAVITLQKIEADERRPSRQMAELLADRLAVPDSERAAFILSARGERSIDRIPLATSPVAVETPPPHQHNLPAPPNTFVGRERALFDVRRLLPPSSPPTQLLLARYR
jgi:transcriptional regulator with XRE-family HTH domain